MNRVLCTLVTFSVLFSVLLGGGMSGVQAATVDDYAFQAQLSEPDDNDLSTEANTQSLRRFDVPIEMLLKLVKPDLSDIIVFNAQGQVLPMSVHPIQGETVTKKDILPFHIFSRYRQTGQKTVTIEAKTGGDDAENMAQSTTQTVTENVAVQAREHDYLIELKPTDDSPTYDRLELSWGHKPDDQLVSLRVEAGQKLDNLRIIHSAKQLTKKLSEDTHSKSIEGFSARDRYVRLTLVNKLQRFTLTQVAGVYQEKSAVPMVIHEVPLTEDQEVRAKKQAGYVYRVAVPWVIRPHQIVIEPARANRVLTGDLFVQPTGQDERRLIRRDFQQHNLTADAAPPSDPLSLPASPFESIHVVLDQPVDGMATVQLRFPAWQVTFLSDGLTPYTVAWGRYAAASVAPDLSKLVRQSTHDIQNNALELVLGEMMEAGGEEKRMTPTRLPWKKWLLWACLLLGVLITAWMAYQLSREMKGQAGDDDGL